jgi:hypothetical protein
VGIVEDSTTVPPTRLPYALILSTQELGSDITTYSRANEDGVYFFPSIVPGMGKVDAFSEDGGTKGTMKPVDIQTGLVFGDDVGEDTLVTVKLGGQPPLLVWIDFAGAGNGDGTFGSPFNLLSEGVNEVAEAGNVNIKGDTASSNAPGARILDKAMTINGINGVVTIGGSS